jgi:O-antigen ligase
MDASAQGHRGTLALFVVVTAGLAGLTTAVAGNLFGERAAYYFAVFGSLAAGTLVAATRKEPLRFVFLALIAAFPIASVAVPPGRLDLMVFDVAMVVLTIGLLMRNASSPPHSRQPLMPTRSLAIAWLLCIPCVVLAQFPVHSAIILGLMFALYAFFLLALAELKRERGFERLVMLLSIASIVMAIGVLIDFTFQVNLSTHGGNINQLSYSQNGEIYRAGGFFQDPQRAGDFFATLITFQLVLAVRGRFRGRFMRTLLWIAILAGFFALPMTIARSAILSCLAVSALALFAFNAWPWHLKAAIAVPFVVAATFLWQTPLTWWLSVLPSTIGDRFREVPEEFAARVAIWMDTWDMFSKHPATGIGLGGFRSYLLQTRPGVTNYYDIGIATGVDYIPDQPESGYLKIFYEGGIVGSIAALIVAVDAVRRGLRVAAGGTADARTECIAALAGLITFAVSFITLFTPSDPRIGGLLAFLLAVIWHRSMSRGRA